MDNTPTPPYQSPFTPLRDTVIIRVSNPQKSDGGIIVPEIAKANHDSKRAIVVAKGPGRVNAEGITIPLTVPIGASVVIHPEFPCIKMKEGEDFYLLVAEEGIIAIRNHNQ
ncbi:MAG: 10 kDa chaperonin [Nitrospira sp.]|nr:10 kDa chaperonin [Nitrospira sp.]